MRVFVLGFLATLMLGFVFWSWLLKPYRKYARVKGRTYHHSLLGYVLLAVSFFLTSPLLAGMGIGVLVHHYLQHKIEGKGDPWGIITKSK